MVLLARLLPSRPMTSIPMPTFLSLRSSTRARLAVTPSLPARPSSFLRPMISTPSRPTSLLASSPTPSLRITSTGCARSSLISPSGFRAPFRPWAMSSATSPAVPSPGASSSPSSRTSTAPASWAAQATSVTLPLALPSSTAACGAVSLVPLSPARTSRSSGSAR